MANTMIYSSVKTAAVLQAFRNKLGPIFKYIHGAAPEGAVKGNVFKVRTIPVIAGAAYNGSYVGGDTVVTGVDVTLNQHYIAATHVQDAENARGAEGILDGLEIGAINGLAKTMFDYIAGLVTEANWGTGATNELVIDPATLDSDDMADAALLLDNKKAPDGYDASGLSERVAFLTHAAINSLRKDDAVKDASKSLSDEALRQGVVSRLSGIDIYPITALPTAVSDENTYGFVSARDAIAWGSVVVEPQGILTGEFLRVTEDETGALFGLRRFYDQLSGKMNVTAEALWGASKNNAAGLIRLASA